MPVFALLPPVPECRVEASVEIHVCHYGLDPTRGQLILHSRDRGRRDIAAHVADVVEPCGVIGRYGGEGTGWIAGLCETCGHRLLWRDGALVLWICVCLVGGRRVCGIGSK